MRRFIAIAGILLSAPFARAASSPSPQITLALDLQPAVTLPGMPVSFRVTFTNATGSPLTIPTRAALLVRDEQGQSFLAVWDVTRTVVTVDEWSGQKISPRQNSSYTLSTEGLMDHPAWFRDSRLSRPGRFELQMFVADNLSELLDIEEVRQRAAISNVAVLTVQEPSGVDADVWRIMRALNGGRWGASLLYVRSGQDLAKRIITEYPSSSYVPWLASMGAAPTADERESILRDWLSRAPEDSNTNWRRLRLAEWQISLGDKYGRQKQELSNSYRTNARAILNSILKQSDDVELKKLAKDRLDYLDDPPIDWEKE
jgi:hypothetical protein